MEYRWRAAKINEIYLIFQRKKREKAMQRSEIEFSLLTVYVSACHWVSFWRDVVF